MFDKILNKSLYLFLFLVLGIGFLTQSNSMCCCQSKCKEICILIHQSFIAQPSYNQAFLDTVQVTAPVGFSLVHYSSQGMLYDPNGQGHPVRKSAPNDDLDSNYIFGQNISNLTGSWKIVFTVIVEDKKGNRCTCRVSIPFEVQTQGTNKAHFVPTRYKRFLFEESVNTPLTNVQLIYDGDSYDLEAFYPASQAGANALKADFENTLDLIGLTVDPFGDMFPGQFGYTSNNGWILPVFANDGQEDRIELVSDNGVFFKNYDSNFENTDEGVFIRFFPSLDETYGDLSNFRYTLGNQFTFESITGTYTLISLLSAKKIDINTWVGNNAQLTINGNIYPIDPVNPSDLTQVAQAIEAALIFEDQLLQTQGEVNGNYYTPEVIYNSGSNRMKLRYPNTWTVTLEDNGSNLPLNNIGSGNVQTGYQGYMTTNSPPSGFPANFFVAAIFNVLGVVGNEPSITLEYEMNGQARVQIFTYDPSTKTYS